jgi:hypothetical protein
MPRLKLFNEEAPVLGLDEQLLTAQKEYDEAISKLREMEERFEESAVAVTSDQFQRLESNLRQQRMITEAKHRLLEDLGQQLFNERRQAEQKQAAAARASQRSQLLVRLDSIHQEIQQLEEMKRIPIDAKLQMLDRERSQVLMQLSELKEEVNAA